jgi:hypothetical protein
MKVDSVTTERAIVPKRRQKHYSYDESLDEPGKSSLPMSRSRSNAKFRQKRTNPWKERKRITRRNRLHLKSNVSRVRGRYAADINVACRPLDQHLLSRGSRNHFGRRSTHRPSVGNHGVCVLSCGSARPSPYANPEPTSTIVRVNWSTCVYQCRVAGKFHIYNA